MSVQTVAPKAESLDKLKQQIESTFQQHKEYFHTLQRHTKASDRIAKIKKLRTWVFEHKEDIRKAVYADFKKPEAEADLSEIYPVISEANHTIAHLREWMRPRKVEAPLALMGTRSQIISEPKGVTLIISPWNFPFQLTICPLISAIAAGNTAILKPSEMTPHTSALIEKMVGELFDKDEVTVFQGDKDVSQILLDLPFDHIFFTGSTQVGSIVMRAASKHLTSVTLELGGKSPVVIDETAKLKDAGEKLMWGKLLNCGQACVAPDYVLVHKSKEKDFLNALKQAKEKLYSSDPAQMKSNGDLARVVNDRHFERLTGLIDDAVKRGGEIVFGGQSEAAERYIAPTVIRNVSPDAAIMQEEIFGPILPVLTYSHLDDALRIINAKTKPLALYIFSKSQKNIDYVINRTSAGATGINENVLHFNHPDLPFGGTNHSGHGKSHGIYGFESFSNLRPILKNSTLFSTIKPVAYPPFGGIKEKMIQFLIRWL